MQVGLQEHVRVPLILEVLFIVERIVLQREHSLEVALSQEFLIQVHNHLELILAELLGAVELFSLAYVLIGHTWAEGRQS